MNQINTLSILQYNVRKSRDTVMATLLRDSRVAEFDVLALQEPWRNPYIATTHHPAKDTFHLCCPPDDGESRPARICFFVNKRLDHSKWRFDAHSRDAGSLTIEIQLEDRETTQITIYNVYNPTKGAEDRESVLPVVSRILGTATTTAAKEQMVLGDFNLHHGMWGGEGVAQVDQESEELIDIMASFDLTNTLSPGTVTYEEGNASTTIDLCWVSAGLLDRLITSQVDRTLDHDSDHLPISTILDLRVKHKSTKPVRSWKRLNTEDFCKALRSELPAQRRPRTVASLEKYVQDIVEAIEKASDHILPLRQPSPKARDGWTTECSEVLAEAKRLKRRHSREHTEESWEAYRTARNHKTRTIRTALRKEHRDRIETAAQSPESLWKISKWARNRENQAPSITPAIKCPRTGYEVREVESKAELFREAFFPPPALADLTDTQDAQYAGQIDLPPITEKEVMEAMLTTKPMKAPGPDGIPNKALQAAAKLLGAHLTSVFNQSLNLGHCPAHFRCSTTVVLRKPGKDDYTVPKAYRPIALLNTIGKIMDAVLARRLSYLVETENVLPNSHMGGRKKRSTEHGLHAIIEKIYAAWNTAEGQVASLLLLDVSGAFDNVSHQRLLHNLRTRKVDEKLVRWIASFLSNRRTRITIDGYESAEHCVETGIPQGSPLSPVLYIFYNAGLIEECNIDEGSATVGYIDDAAILAWGNATTETCQKLATSLEQAQRWAATHASKFAPEKFQLTHFTRARTRHDVTRGIDTTWCHIEPQPTCRYLGVTMDTKLQWKAHIEGIQRKVSKTVHTIGALGNSKWGVGMLEMRKIYRGVAVPQMMYGCSLWSNARDMGQAYTMRTLQALQSLQARAARAICGAFKATSAAALDVETFLLPVKAQIEKHNAEALGRMLSCTNLHGIESIRLPDQCRTRRSRHISPLENIRRKVRNHGCEDTCTLERVPAFVTPPWWQGPQIHIDDTDEARSRCEQAQHNEDAIAIYTDGSSVNGHVGAAAVRSAAERSKSTYMGSTSTTTGYLAELQGINLALSMAQEDTEGSPRVRQVAIWSDSQAAIRSLGRSEGRSGAYLLKQIVKRVQSLRKRGHTVTVRWIPSHQNIAGNVEADKAAKKATGWRSDGSIGQKADPLEEHYRLQTTMKAWCRKQSHEQWQTTWQANTKGRVTYRYVATPSKGVLRLHEGLSKSQSSLLVQLRTEKIGLRDFLFHRGVPDISSPACTCREGRQTVRHVMLACRELKDLRQLELGRESGTTDLRTILTNRKLAIKAIRFIEQALILGRDGIAEE